MVVCPKIKDFMSKIILGERIRQFIFKKYKRKIVAQTYQAFRLFQNLPTKGQRTRANANTPRHYNPFLALNIDNSYYQEQQPLFKDLELTLNERTEELKALKKAEDEKRKNRKKDRRQQLKEQREKFIKDSKLFFKDLRTKIRKKGRTVSRKMGRKDKKK